MDPTPLRMPPRHQRRPCWTTYRVRIRLREPHSRSRKPVNIGRPEVGGAIAIGINRPLVVGQNDEDVRPLHRRHNKCREGKQEDNYALHAENHFVEE